MKGTGSQRGTLAALLAVATQCAIAEPRASVTVGSVDELIAAVRQANETGNTDVLLRDGTYALQQALRIMGDDITLRSQSGLRDQVVLEGRGMRATKGVDNLVEVSGQRVSLIGLTLQETGNHLIQLRGERDADDFRLINCVLRDSYEQLLKVSSDNDGDPSADRGIVRESLFEYSASLGPNYYIGGIDLHSGKDWRIERNTFRNIASPAGQVAEHAVHIWKGSADNIVHDNLIINSDRGIGFGLTDEPYRMNRGGEVTGNVIIHNNPAAPFSDAGIVLEGSPDTLVLGNIIQLGHNYPNAIEYRFTTTTGVQILANWTNKGITSRDGATAIAEGNRAGGWLQLVADYLRLFWRTRVN